MAHLPLAPESASTPANEESRGAVESLLMSATLATEEELENEFLELDALTLRSERATDGAPDAIDADGDLLELLPLTDADNVWLHPSCATPCATEAAHDESSDDSDCDLQPRHVSRPLDLSDSDDDAGVEQDYDVPMEIAGYDSADESESDIAWTMINGAYQGPRSPDASSDDDRVDETRPSLPPPPAAHPLTGRPNCFDPAAPFDPEADYDVFAVLDRAGQRPYRCYLVQWFDEQRNFVATWEWESLLRSADVTTSLNWIDRWKDEFPQLPFVSYRRRFPIPFTADTDSAPSDKSCFFRAMLLACRVLGQVLITEAHVDKFIIEENARRAVESESKVESTSSCDPGVTRADILRFVKFAVREKAALGGQVFKYNHAQSSLTSVFAVDQLDLLPGVYVVGAGCVRGIRHCFVLEVPADFSTKVVFYDFDLEDPRPEPLMNIEWIKSVQFIHKIERVGRMDRKDKRKTKGKANKTKAKKVKTVAA